MKRLWYGMMPYLRRGLLCFLVPVLFCSLPAGAQDKIHLRVGAYSNPPKMIITDNGKVTGFWPELLAHIAEEENWEIEYIAGSWTDNLNRLILGEIDMMPDVAFTKTRSKLYNFADSTVIASWSRVYVRKSDEEINTLSDLHGKRIAGLSGSVNIDGPNGIKYMVQSFNLDSRVFEMFSYHDAFQALENGLVDAVVANRSFGDVYAENNPVRETAIMFSPVSNTFAFPKDRELSDHLIRRVDLHMSSMISNRESIYYSLLTKYFETNIVERPVPVIPKWMMVLIAASFAAAGIMVGAYLAVRHQVKSKTAELTALNHHLRELVDAETAKRLQNEQIIFEQKKFADMGHMIGAISHQWRQPLNNTYLISQWLQEQWEKGDPFDPSHEEAFERQAEIIAHMSGTIDDFINFFRPDKKKNTFDVTQTVLKCLRLVSHELFHHKIHLKFRCRCESRECELRENLFLPSCDKITLTTEGFEGEFKQILLNLISNSRDAIVDRSPAMRKINVNVNTSEDNIIISVEDNGGGVPEEILGKIFDPYFTTKMEGRGIGMGLYMSRMILENHMNGSLKMENIKDGARASILLKRITEKDPSEP